MANEKPLFTEITEDGQLKKFADTQHFTGPNNEGRVRTGEKDPFPVKYEELKNEVEQIKTQQEEILNYLKGEITIKETGNNVGYSTETKPSDSNKGDTFLELDTSDIFVYDGNDWVVI